ncbi:MAG: hypothetical protein JNM83_06505 [Myxococcales bacterium]|nr:hypothetical protein [Myxococcales bacterium]
MTGLWVVSFVGCDSAIPEDGLCQATSIESSECVDGRGLGAVVVRWRLADFTLGRLLSRGICCCNPNPSRDGIDRQQCSNIGSSCLDSPAWLVQRVRLTLRSTVGKLVYSWDVPCTEGEYTTLYCIVPGTYDMQLTADVNTLAAVATMGFQCANRQATSPPSMRRTVVGGQATNLDAVVLGINAP